MGLILKIFGSPAVAGAIGMGLVVAGGTILLWWNNHNTNLVNKGIAQATQITRDAAQNQEIINVKQAAQISVVTGREEAQATVRKAQRAARTKKALEHIKTGQEAEQWINAIK